MTQSDYMRNNPYRVMNRCEFVQRVASWQNIYRIIFLLLARCSQIEKKGLESCWHEFFKSSLEMRSRFFCLWFILRIYTQWSTCSLIISQNFKENLFRRRWKKYKFMLSFLFLTIQHSNFHMTCSAQQKNPLPPSCSDKFSFFAYKIKMSS